MAKVITFSRYFPAYHPKAGQPTHFVEKIWSGLNIWNNVCGLAYARLMKLNEYNQGDARLLFHNLTEPFNFTGEKYHTIRSGNRWKIGDKFSPRVWSGKPYRSKQVILAGDIEIKRIWDIEIKTVYKELPLDYEVDIIINHRFYHTNNEIIRQLAYNDGLTIPDLLQWLKYPKPFKGQIICWNDAINY